MGTPITRETRWREGQGQERCPSTTYDRLSCNETRCIGVTEHDGRHDDGAITWEDPPPDAGDAEGALVEQVAQAIHHHEGGLGSDDDWKAMYGDRPRKLWKTAAPWDSNPAELTEWQRDDYRAQARAAVAVVREHDREGGEAQRIRAIRRHDAVVDAARELCAVLLGLKATDDIGPYVERLAAVLRAKE